MNYFNEMLNLQLTLFALIILGMLAKKKNILTDNGQKSLSNLLINFILPCNIIESFTGEFSFDLLRNSMIALLISLTIQLVAIIFSKYLFFKYPSNKTPILNYGLICSNSSFIGLPVVNNIFGNLGVLYTSIFQIPIRITMWTSGLTQFTSVDKKSAFKSLLKHPCIVSIAIGFTIMIFQLSPFPFISNAITLMSKCTIPVSMLVIGGILSRCNIKQMFDTSTLYFTLIRLILFPLVVFAILKECNVDPLIIGISTVLTGMPAGTTTAILADKYQCDAIFASKIVFISTLLSIVTIPVLCLLL